MTAVSVKKGPAKGPFYSTPYSNNNLTLTLSASPSPAIPFSTGSITPGNSTCCNCKFNATVRPALVKPSNTINMNELALIWAGLPVAHNPCPL